MSAVRRSSPDCRSADGAVKLNCALKVVEQQLKALCQVVGYWSISRKAMTNIGKALLKSGGGGLEIVCPVCISHKELEDDKAHVPDMVLKHVPFLDLVKGVLPMVTARFLFPTHEAGKSADAIRAMCQMTQASLLDSGHDAMEMIEYAPNMSEEEERVRSDILADPDRYGFLVDMVTRERTRYYTEKRISDELRKRKVIKLVAEFLSLGQLAVYRGALVCSVTTGRIRCLTQAGAGVLHNPVGFIM